MDKMADKKRKIMIVPNENGWIVSLSKTGCEVGIFQEDKTWIASDANVIEITKQIMERYNGTQETQTQN